MTHIGPSIRFFVLFFILTTILLSCISAKQKESKKNTYVPKEMKLLIGKGGGFTGKWNGYTIYGNGKVVSWSGRWEEQNIIEETITLSDAELSQLWEKVNEIEFFNQKISETGNIISVLEITTDLLTNRATWISGTENIDEPQHEIEELFWEINNKLSTLTNK